jgi:hypothetical protein
LRNAHGHRAVDQALRQIAREDRLRQEIDAIGEGRQASAAARS